MEQDHSCTKKKERKPYTLTKQRESWTNDEHERFIKALQLYNRDWKKIESYVGTKTVVQVMRPACRPARWLAAAAALIEVMRAF